MTKFSMELSEVLHNLSVNEIDSLMQEVQEKVRIFSGNPHQSQFIMGESIIQVIKKRKQILLARQLKREIKFQTEEYRNNRKEMVKKVARIYSIMVSQSITDLDEGKQDLREISLSFNENLYNRRVWNTEVVTGFASTSSFFVAGTFEAEECIDICCAKRQNKKEDMYQQTVSFMLKIVIKMKLSTEIILLALIFVEKLLVRGANCRKSLKCSSWFRTGGR